jgi:hypothetical protein
MDCILRLKAKGCFSTVLPEKWLEAQQTTIPQEAPAEGLKSKLSNLFGANWRVNCKSMNSFFVSCRQKILAQLSSILFLMEYLYSIVFLNQVIPEYVYSIPPL